MRIFSKIIGTALLLAGLLALQVPSAHAQDLPDLPSSGYEHIVNFRSNIVVHKDGSVDINEKIKYDFGYSYRHGIFRYVPFEYPWNGERPKDAVSGSKYVRVTPLEINSVSRDGNDSENYEVSVQSGNKVLKIGDADKTIFGTHDYEISYTLKNFINSFEKLDEFNININGTGWDVSVEKLTTQIQIEGVSNLDKLKTLCFAGPAGSSNECQTPAKNVGNSLIIEQDNLGPNDNVTAIIGVPSGILSPEKPVLKEKWTFASAFRINSATVVGFIVLLILGLGSVGLLVYKTGRDKRFVGNAVDAAMGNYTGEDQPKPLFASDTNPVEFIPPDKIRPGQIGVLVDEKVDNVDITATIVDLAVRGFIYIGENQTERKTLFGFTSTDLQYWISKMKEYKDDPTLNNYERKLLSALFSKKDKYFLSELTASQGTKIQEVKDELYKDVVQNKWYKVRPDKTRNIWFGIALGFFLVVWGLFFVLARFTHFAISASALPIVGIVFMSLSTKMPARTAKGTAMVGRVAGFRELFDVGEGERQAFAEKANLFLEYLPYAIVFGCADKWAKVFEDLGLTQEQLGVDRFYTGSSAFSAMHFAYAMNSFSAATFSSIASAQAAAAKSFSSGSSGFSGGGFSGGGGGGGGGGSW